MPKSSTREKKNIYLQRREDLKLTREQASELLECISADRLDRIENEKAEPRPEEVLIMAEKYKSPELCNYYCSHQCMIGSKYVPEVQIHELPQIILKMVAALNDAQDKQKRLISITEDGKIDDDEIEDFVTIQENLEKISVSVEALQIWTEQMLAKGNINLEMYNAEKEKRKKK
jgi:hypothetical protein